VSSLAKQERVRHVELRLKKQIPERAPQQMAMRRLAATKCIDAPKAAATSEHATEKHAVTPGRMLIKD